jgi:hypothetical protein
MAMVRYRFPVFRDIDDDDPLRATDLGRCNTDRSRSSLTGLLQISDKGAQFIVKPLYRCRELF